MATIKGYNGSIKAGDTPTTVGEVKNYNIDQSSDIVETSTLGSDWGKNVPTLKRWSGSLVAHFDIGDSGQDEIRSALSSGASVALELYIGGESGVGNTKYNGTAVIETISVGNDVAGIVEASISFTGTGALTETPLV